MAITATPTAMDMYKAMLATDYVSRKCPDRLFIAEPVIYASIGAIFAWSWRGMAGAGPGRGLAFALVARMLTQYLFYSTRKR